LERKNVMCYIIFKEKKTLSKLTRYILRSIIGGGGGLQTGRGSFIFLTHHLFINYLNMINTKSKQINFEDEDETYLIKLDSVNFFRAYILVDWTKFRNFDVIEPSRMFEALGKTAVS
ncbi:hypothetical protein ACJX0J_013143, partial [Zea mays]